MKDDDQVKKLVELIFVKKYEVTSEMKAPNSAFPPCLLKNDFAQKLSHVLTVKRAIIYIKWAATFNVFYERDVLSNHKSYLTSIIFNCLKEIKYQSTVFDRFITLCSTVDFYSGETLLHAGLNYCDLNTDIVMEVYKRYLKKTLIRRNGFSHLIEYITNHKYLLWDLELVKRSVNEDPSDPLVDYMENKIIKEIYNEQKTLHSFSVNLDGLEGFSNLIAMRILSTTSVKLPTFSSNYDSKEAVNTSSLKGPSKLHSSAKHMRREDPSFTSVELPTLSSHHDLEEIVNASSFTDQSKLHASTKSMTHENPSTTSIELSTVSSNYGSNEAANASSLKGPSKLHSSTKPMRREDPSTTSVELPSHHGLEETESARSFTDQSKLHASSKSMTREDPSTISVELSTVSNNYDTKEAVNASSLKGPSKLHSSTNPMRREDPSTTSVELPSHHGLEETVSARSFTDQSKLHASTKSKTQENNSTTSVELSTVSSDRNLEAVSAPSLNDTSKLHSSTKSPTQKDLSTTSTEHSTLSYGYDSKSMVNDAKVEDEVKVTTELNLKFKPIEMPHNCSEHIETKQPENIEWYESFVQAVIKYNQSKTAYHVPVENSIQKIAGEVLEHLEDTIKSVIELLNEYDE